MLNKKSNVFDYFGAIADSLNKNLLEISLKRGHMDFYFDEGILYMSDADTIKMLLGISFSDKTFFTFLNDYPIFSVPLDEEKEPSDIYLFFKGIITQISEKICECPMTEVIISDKYVKCYLDKPGLTISDLIEYEKIFNLKGTLELHGQRPYLLLIREVGGPNENEFDK